MLLQLSHFPLLCPSTQHPPLPQAITPLLFMSTGHGYKFFGYSISYTYFTSPWLFSPYVFVLLNPLNSSPILLQPLPSGNHQNALHFHDSASVLLVYLVCFLDLILNRHVFINILLFIILIFFLNKFLYHIIYHILPCILHTFFLKFLREK